MADSNTKITGRKTRVYSEEVTAALDKLALYNNGITLYRAGLPSFPSNFTRDSILSAILLEDSVMLRDQLTYCALLQGAKNDAITGEEPGKIFHEMPASKLNGLSTEYNACDTTALFIYGHEKYLDMTGDESFIHRQKNYLEKAVDYILSHLVANMFSEDPKYSGASRYSLNVTYWKDSQVTNRENGVPAYPAVFTLAHVQNMRALKSAARLLHAPDLYHMAREMKRHLTILYDENRGIFYSGVDKKGFFMGDSSDNLHLLYYLEPDEISEDRLEKLVKSVSILETDIGYMTLNTQEAWLKGDITHHTGYHTNTVWPFEQAFIHMGAEKFHLKHVAQVCERIIPKLDSFPELYVLENGAFNKKGSAIQLWTIAAKVYFDRIKVKYEGILL